jgi:proteic killer suppression protein
MIKKNYRDRETAKIGSGLRSRSLPPDIHRRSAIKLNRIDAASTLDETHLGPGDDFKPRSDLGTDIYSIRINDQWRVFFRWADGDAYDVEIDDKH